MQSRIVGAPGAAVLLCPVQKEEIGGPYYGTRGWHVTPPFYRESGKPVSYLRNMRGGRPCQIVG